MDATPHKSTAAKTMKASEFRANCLKLMDEIAEAGGEIIITKHGKPISKLVPYKTAPNNQKPPKTFFGSDKGRIEILGDIVSPMPAEWFEDPDHSRNELF